MSDSPYPASTFGEYIRKARLDKGLEQAEVARVVGVDEMIIVNWEKGRAFPTRHPQKVKAMCALLRLSYSEMWRRFADNREPDGRYFGAKLKRARLARGLTQEEAARLCGVYSCTLRRWEKYVLL